MFLLGQGIILCVLTGLCLLLLGSEKQILLHMDDHVSSSKAMQRLLS